MNSLFIGIGGAGCSAVAVFAQKIRDHGANENNAFLYLDTDKGICETFPFIMANGEFVGLGGSERERGNSIQNIIDEAHTMVSSNVEEVQKRKFKRFLDWYDENIVSNEELTKGAEGIRMMSRTMLFANYDTIKTTIQNNMTYDDHGHTRIRKIYVVSGTCGGTGSGCVIDILYMLKRIREEQNDRATELPINLLLVMPQGYINGIPDNSPLYTPYRTNAYAIVNEINALLKDYYGYYSERTDRTIVGNQTTYTIRNQKAGKKMNAYSCTDEGGQLQFNVFQNAYLFDSVTSDGQNMSHEQRSENVANFLFALEVGKQANALLDTTISNNVRTAKFLSAGKDFICAFAASGMYVAQSWEELTRKFVREKFLYQMLHDSFIGDETAMPEELVSTDVSKFGDQVLIIINDAKNESGTGIKDLLRKIAGGYGFDDLAQIMQDFKDSTNVNKPSIAKVFVSSNDKDDVNALARAVDQVLSKVKDTTYSMTEEWVKKYNLNRALQLVKTLDAVYDKKYKELKEQIINFKLDAYTFSFSKTEKRRSDCIELFDRFIDFLVYRALSYENEGYLDNCKTCLGAAIRAIHFDEHKLNGKKVVDWQFDFIKYLNTLSTDVTRSVWPSLEGLYNPDGSCLIKGNSVESDYAALVSQTETGDAPDLSFNLDDHHLLLTYKHKCFESLNNLNAKWTGYFDMSNGSDTFARNILVAFETFEKQVEQLGVELSNSPSLKKPFSSLVLGAEEKAQLIKIIKDFDHVSLATQYHLQNQQHVDIYVGDFNNLPWLNAALFPVGYNQMEKSRAQDDQISDRIMKLYVEFGHPFNDYRYFNSVYVPFFQEFHSRAITQPKQRHHQPFIDKRFFELGDVHAYFTQTETKEKTREVIDMLKNHKVTFMKFCAWFLYQILVSHENEGLLAEKGLSSDKYYKLDGETVTFGLTDYFDHWKNAEKYELSQIIKIDMSHNYKDSEVKCFSECLDLWYRILQDQGMNSYLDEEKLIEVFDATRIKMSNSKNTSLTIFLSTLERKYVSINDEGRRIVDWRQMFGDFLMAFPVKRRTI